ncbi:hypothetical protein [Alloactinosynnema sp. L-07]|uniref:hypothetical protein n=1 Tax=Alloactinosynnema sp. L-07 TaxID=1653480 RepID=UPI0012FB57D6|nr:hypothetical protein [Alloactinosynnema sp. L-07]
MDDRRRLEQSPNAGSGWRLPQRSGSQDAELPFSARSPRSHHCLVRLREKGCTVRWQPITPALAACLTDHAAARGAVLPTDQLLRYRNGQPITSRRYDHLWHRIGQQLPWVATQTISTYWLRHTTLTWVERHFGYGIARACAGHTDNTGPAATTYIKANLQEVATALTAMTGQPHPLAG